MFSGRHSLIKDEHTDAYFIDRDGASFRYILNYLRMGRLIIPEGDSCLERELLEEARYYQISSLVNLLQPSKQSFVFESEGDLNGLFYWLGTAGGTRTWHNPFTSGAVRIRSSKKTSGDFDGLVGRTSVAGGICTDSRGQWVEFDIGKDRLMCLSHYSVRHGECCRLGNWILQGSDDREHWTEIVAHTNDFWNVEIKAWKLPKGKKNFFRWFRMVGNGCDAESATCYCLHFSCLELYGDLRMKKRER
jgi:hypothetical protein